MRSRRRDSVARVAADTTTGSGLPYPSALLFFCGLAVALLHNGGADHRFLAISVLLVTLAFGLALIARGPVRIELPKHGASVLAASFACWAMLSLTWSVAPGPSLLAAAQYALIPVVLLLGYWSRLGIKEVLSGCLLIGLVVAGLTVYQGFWLDVERPGAFMVNWNSNAALLNLLLLPLLASALNTQQSRIVFHALVAACAFLAFAEALTLSRGGLAALLVAMAALGFIAGRWKRLLIAAAIILGAYTLGSLAHEGTVLGRLGASLSAHDITSGRLTIWATTWEMYLLRPLLGWGADTFWLVYPQFRDALEGSSGQRVHGDYLEFLFEFGPVGALLFLGFLASIAHLWVGRLSRGQGVERHQAAGLVTGLLAVSLHAAVDFHFHQFSILLLTGFFTGRLLALASSDSVRPFVRVPPRLWVAGIFFICFLPLGWSAGLYLSEHALGRIEQARNAGEVFELIDRAERLYPYRDTPQLLFARQMEKALSENPELAWETKATFVNKALNRLDQGKVHNPLRWDGELQRALLKMHLPDSTADVEKHLRAALQLNPGFIEARLLLAQNLVLAGDIASANETLEQGWRRVYHGRLLLGAKYADLLASTRKSLGRETDALKAVEESERLLASIRDRGEFVRTYYLGR